MPFSALKLIFSPMLVVASSLESTNATTKPTPLIPTPTPVAWAYIFPSTREVTLISLALTRTPLPILVSTDALLLKSKEAAAPALIPTAGATDKPWTLELLEAITVTVSAPEILALSSTIEFILLLSFTTPIEAPNARQPATPVPTLVSEAKLLVAFTLTLPLDAILLPLPILAAVPSLPLVLVFVILVARVRLATFCSTLEATVFPT